MILIVSHFADNKGTTDFLIDYLLEEGEDFYLLKHPFIFAKSEYSELYLYSAGIPHLLARYKKLRSNALNLIKNFYISAAVSFKLKIKVDHVISFGSFNAVPYIITNPFFRRRVYFWGVDYSRKRFTNLAFNKIYLEFETLACRYSSYVINQSERQEAARIKYHGLSKEKSIVSANGVSEVSIMRESSRFADPTLLYMGSITEQHGIIDFVRFFYVENDISIKLTIIGAGEEEAALMEVMEKSHDSRKIVYMGFKSQQEIRDYLLENNQNYFGIAPYSDQYNDHVYYGDSLKIKEYLTYNMPFITSEVVYVQPELIKFGIIYNSFDDLLPQLTSGLNNWSFNIDQKNRLLNKYRWSEIFMKTLSTIQNI